jgi:hypothetical protein
MHGINFNALGASKAASMLSPVSVVDIPPCARRSLHISPLLVACTSPHFWLHADGMLQSRLPFNLLQLQYYCTNSIHLQFEATARQCYTAVVLIYMAFLGCCCQLGASTCEVQQGE